MLAVLLRLASDERKLYEERRQTMGDLNKLDVFESVGWRYIHSASFIDAIAVNCVGHRPPFTFRTPLFTRRWVENVVFTTFPSRLNHVPQYKTFASLCPQLFSYTESSRESFKSYVRSTNLLNKIVFNSFGSRPNITNRVRETFYTYDNHVPLSIWWRLRRR